METVGESVAWICLHVEAHPESAQRFRRAFEALRCDGELIQVSDGLDAMRHILEKGTPRLLMVSLQEGRLHGFELIRWIRNHPRFASLPIFVCNEATDPRCSETCRHLGVDGRLDGAVRPGDIEDILLRTATARPASGEAPRGGWAWRLFSHRG